MIAAVACGGGDSGSGGGTGGGGTGGGLAIVSVTVTVTETVTVTVTVIGPGAVWPAQPRTACGGVRARASGTPRRAELGVLG